MGGIKRQDPPPLNFSDVIQRKAEQYACHRIGCRSWGKDCYVIIRLPSGLHSSYSFRVDSFSLSYPLGDHKVQWCYLTLDSWGSVHEHQGIFHSPVDLLAACLGADLLRILVIRPGAVGCPVYMYRHGEALYRACRRRGYVLAERERDLRNLLSFSR